MGHHQMSCWHWTAFAAAKQPQLSEIVSETGAGVAAIDIAAYGLDVNWISRFTGQSARSCCSLSKECWSGPGPWGRLGHFAIFWSISAASIFCCVCWHDAASPSVMLVKTPFWFYRSEVKLTTLGPRQQGGRCAHVWLQDEKRKPL